MPAAGASCSVALRMQCWHCAAYYPAAALLLFWRVQSPVHDRTTAPDLRAGCQLKQRPVHVLGQRLPGSAAGRGTQGGLGHAAHRRERPLHWAAQRPCQRVRLGWGHLRRQHRLAPACWQQCAFGCVVSWLQSHRVPLQPGSHRSMSTRPVVQGDPHVLPPAARLAHQVWGEVLRRSRRHGGQGALAPWLPAPQLLLLRPRAAVWTHPEVKGEGGWRVRMGGQWLEGGRSASQAQRQRPLS